MLNGLNGGAAQRAEFTMQNRGRCASEPRGNRSESQANHLGRTKNRSETQAKSGDPRANRKRLAANRERTYSDPRASAI